MTEPEGALGNSKIVIGWAEVWAVWELKAGVGTKDSLVGDLAFWLVGSDPNSR